MMQLKAIRSMGRWIDFEQADCIRDKQVLGFDDVFKRHVLVSPVGRLIR